MRGVGVKNDHIWVNMVAHGCRRVSKHVRTKIKRNRAHDSPQIVYLISCLNTETRNNYINFAEKCKNQEIK